jgi:hypothetical protein
MQFVVADKSMLGVFRREAALYPPQQIPLPFSFGLKFTKFPVIMLY